MTQTLVMLTDGNEHGLRILEGLKQRGASLDAVVVESRPRFRDNLGKAQPGVRGRLLPVWRWLRSLQLIGQARNRYGIYAQRLVITGPLNSERMAADLRSVAPDFLVLGGVGILKANTLETARLGVVNAHPGLLPWIRGSGVVGRAIERNIPVGASTHYVRAGIDTGDIIERRLLPPAGLDTLDKLESAADHLASQMMVDLICEVLTLKAPPVGHPQSIKTPICKWLSPEERAVVDVRVKGGSAKELFEMWRPYCIDQVRFVLPGAFRGPEIG